MAEFRHLLMQSDVPLLSKGLVNHWEQIKWNQEKWISVLGEETYPFRSAANKCSEVLYLYNIYQFSDYYKNKIQQQHPYVVE